MKWVNILFIVHKGIYQPLPHFKIIPPLLGSPPPFLNIRHPPPYRQIVHHKFSLLIEMQPVKLSSINTIHVKQQHNVGFFIIKFILKRMLGNVFVNKTCLAMFI